MAVPFRVACIVGASRREAKWSEAASGTAGRSDNNPGLAGSRAAVLDQARTNGQASATRWQDDTDAEPSQSRLALQPGDPP
jgi:hypothetical protein